MAAESATELVEAIRACLPEDREWDERGPRCWSSSRRTSESVRLEGGVGVYVNELSCELERVQWADHDRLARAGERVGSAVDRFLAATQNARALIGGNR
jgi:hypothetical protein